MQNNILVKPHTIGGDLNGQEPLSWSDVEDQPQLGNVDIAVIGAGPAGSATAIQCCKEGLTVALVDRESFPRFRPGETLHPGVEPLLAQLGVLETLLREDLIRHTGIRLTTPHGTEIHPYGKDDSGPWLGFQVPRSLLDNILCKHAEKSGCKVFQSCRGMDPITRDGVVEGILTDRGVLKARYVVDAAGSVHWSTRKCNEKLISFSPQLITWFGYCEGYSSHYSELPGFSMDKKGWTWIARVAPKLYQWSRLNWQGDNHSAEIPSELQTLKSLDAPRGMDVTWRRVEVPATPGCIRVGDAAGLLDPSAGHGVLKALMSGILAAHVITKILKYGAEQNQTLEAYNQWFQSFLDHDMIQLKERFLRYDQGKV